MMGTPFGGLRKEGPQALGNPSSYFIDLCAKRSTILITVNFAEGAAMAPRSDRKLAAILAADVVGYSRLVGDDEAGTIARVKALRKECIEPLVAEYHGREFTPVGYRIATLKSGKAGHIATSFVAPDTQNGPGAPCCAPRTRSPSKNSCLGAAPWAFAASMRANMATEVIDIRAFINGSSPPFPGPDPMALNCS